VFSPRLQLNRSSAVVSRVEHDEFPADRIAAACEFMNSETATLEILKMASILSERKAVGRAYGDAGKLQGRLA
jgi:hypothetical protein